MAYSPPRARIKSNVVSRPDLATVFQLNESHYATGVEYFSRFCRRHMNACLVHAVTLYFVLAWGSFVLLHAVASLLGLNALSLAETSSWIRFPLSIVLYHSMAMAYRTHFFQMHWQNSPFLPNPRRGLGIPLEVILFAFIWRHCLYLHIEYLHGDESLPFVSKSSDSTRDAWITYESNRILFFAFLVFEVIFYFVPLVSRRNVIKIPPLQRGRMGYLSAKCKDAFVLNAFCVIVFGAVALVSMVVLQRLNLLFTAASPPSLILTWQETLAILRLLLATTFVSNWLWLVADIVRQRVLTEVPNMKQPTNPLFPSAKVVNYRYMGLAWCLNTRDKVTRKYFWLLSLHDLMRSANNSRFERSEIFESEKLWKVIVGCLLSDITCFVSDVFEHMDQYYGKKSFSYWESAFSLRWRFSQIFQNHQAIICSADILSFIVVRSHDEDSKGVVRRHLSVIINSLLDVLRILDSLCVSPSFRQCHHSDARDKVWNKEYGYVYKSLELSLMRIVRKFQTQLLSVDLRRPNGELLNNYILG